MATESADVYKIYFCRRKVNSKDSVFTYSGRNWRFQVCYKNLTILQKQNNNNKKKQSSCSYSKPFYHGKTIKQRVTAPLPWDIQPGFWTPRLKQHVLKHGKPNTPEHVNWITQTERKNEYFTDWVGVSVYLFVCFFSLYRLPGLLEFSGCPSGVSVHTT